jgi:hypothetical protein
LKKQGITDHAGGRRRASKLGLYWPPFWWKFCPKLGMKLKRKDEDSSTQGGKKYKGSN